MYVLHSIPFLVIRWSPSFILQLYKIDIKPHAYEAKNQNNFFQKHSIPTITAFHSAQDRSTSSALPASYVCLYINIHQHRLHQSSIQKGKERYTIHTRFRTRRSPNLPLPPIPIIPHITRPKNTIQQPASNPVRAVFAIRRPALE